MQWEGSEGIRARPSTEGPRRYQRRACDGKAAKGSADGHRRKGRKCISGERAVGRRRRHQRTAISGRPSAGYVKFQHPMYFSHRWENGRGISARPTTECPRRFYFSLACGEDISVRPSTEGLRMYQRRACGGKESAHGHGRKIRGGFFLSWEGGEDISVRSSTEGARKYQR